MIEDLTRDATTPAAAGIAKPVKYFPSDSATVELNRANRTAPMATYANITATPNVPCPLNAQE